MKTANRLLFKRFFIAKLLTYILYKLPICRITTNIVYHQPYGNVKKGDELVEGIEAGVLASVLNIHDRVRGEVYKLGQVLLRPAFGFSSALDFLAQGAAVQTFSYWYILTSPLYYFTFRVRQIERNIGKQFDFINIKIVLRF